MGELGDLRLTSEVARAAFREFLAMPPSRVVMHAADCDGLASAALWQRAAAKMGWQPAQLWSPAPTGAATLPQPGPYVALGDFPGAAADMTRLVPTPPSHGQDDGLPFAEKQALSCTSVWLWELWHDIVDVQNDDWLGALGCFQSAGRLSVPWIQAMRARCTLKYLRTAARLVEAAGRGSVFVPHLAIQALLAAESPRALVGSAAPESRALHDMADEVDASFEHGKRAQPYLCGRLAVIGVRQSCRIEDWLARWWSVALPKHVVLVGNEGYAPGVVCYASAAACGMLADDFLRAAGWPEPYRAWGCMPLTLWHRLLAGLQVPSGELVSLPADTESAL